MTATIETFVASLEGIYARIPVVSLTMIAVTQTGQILRIHGEPRGDGVLWRTDCGMQSHSFSGRIDGV